MRRRRPAAGRAARGEDCARPEGADRDRAAPSLVLSLLAALGLAALGACGPAATTPEAGIERSPAGLEQIPLTIRSAGGTHRFTVEVARTPQEQAQGLMFRQSLADDRGMLFPYDEPQLASFWMKNTYIPLDIIFIRPDRRIARIAENTVPLSLDPVPSLEPISAVLELRGGLAGELGIRPGDRVDW